MSVGVKGQIGSDADVRRREADSQLRFGPVRFLSAVVVRTDGKLLMALDCDGGEPKLRELEPAGRLVAAAGGLAVGSVASESDRQYHIWHTVWR
jgi:hypothetical protein